MMQSPNHHRRTIERLDATVLQIGPIMVLLVWILAGCSPSSQPTPALTIQTPRSPALALVNGTLIDGSGAQPIENAAVVIQDTKIMAAGMRDTVAIPEGTQVIDLGGAAILPGFINAHVHGAYDLERLAAWAQAGVTTVRDLGARSVPAPFSLREEASRDAQYARLVAAGPIITAPDGYPIAVFGSNALSVATPAEARQATNDLLDQGAEVIKIALESGEVFRQAPLPMLSPQQIDTIVDAAHQRGTLVVAHVTVSGDLELALNHDVDDITHMVVDDLSDDLIKRMVADGIYWEPTLELWKGVGRGFDQPAVDNLRRYVAAGGKVALGTDYGGGYSMPFQLGMPIHEMEWMEEAGMTPMEIIIASTRNAAHVCNQEQDLGTLEAGKIADLIVVEGNPLEDIHALANVLWIIHNGVVIRDPTP